MDETKVIANTYDRIADLYLDLKGLTGILHAMADASEESEGESYDLYSQFVFLEKAAGEMKHQAYSIFTDLRDALP